ncbi:MAG: 2-oxoacid:acceptor oxidoreductase subunit alpha [Firmicutes bacterium]|nr:2-oxoacid:acceptor oxidoreductase subunit alpha [Bacillota bacterium]
MMRELTWKVGGAQGEGIESTGDIVAHGLHKSGYYVFAYRHFMSLIKGGNTWYKVRISDEPLQYHGDSTDLLIAFDQQTIDEAREELHEGSIIVYDSSKWEVEQPPIDGVILAPIPLTEIAKELGNPVMKNMVSVGATAAMMGIDYREFANEISGRFAKKGDEVVQANMEALRRGYEYFNEHFQGHLDLPPKPASHGERWWISGNEATGAGAVLAGCRFEAAYPITPATEILYWLAEKMPRVGGVAIQVEDEMAACIMAIGANYAGVRAMTTTSGPGFSLMQEAIGMAGMSETPLVIVDVMRGGPSTGLPTKTEQGDLHELLYGSHGDIPRIVLAPTSIEDLFYYIAKAFNLSEQYQCPVLVASDLFLGTSKATVDALDPERIRIERGALLTQEQLLEIAEGAYERYKVTESGISPRSIPGLKNGRFVSLSNEHDAKATQEIEDEPTRIAQMEKRQRKLASFDPNAWGAFYEGPAEADVVLVGWGSTNGQLEEARAILTQEGYQIGHLQVRLLTPFPKAFVEHALAGSKKVVVVENNISGQFAELLKQQLPIHDKLETCLQYSGKPMTVAHVVQRVKEVASLASSIEV